MKHIDLAARSKRLYQMLREQVERGHGLTHFEAVATLALLDDLFEACIEESSRREKESEVETR